jgi:PAS domain S-box-containing protein
MRLPRIDRPYKWLPALIVSLIVAIFLIGVVAMRVVETFLVEATGESLALAASDIADDLDRMLFERYGDIQMLAKAGIFQGRDPSAMSAYLSEVRRSYPVYLWLAVTDSKGRIVASTDPASIGQDRSGYEWFQAVRAGGAVHVRDAEASAETGEVVAVAFTAPLMDPGGKFRGAVTTRVSLPVLEDLFEDTVHALQVQRGAAGTIEWQFMTRDGVIIADSLLHQEGKGLNLKRMGLPSALFTGSARPGYVEEQHLRRQVPVISGYAQTRGYGSFTGFHWGILVRIDRSDTLAPIRAFQWKLGLVGALVVLPLIGFLLWTSGRLKREWLQAQTESARATAAEATTRESEGRMRAVLDSALDAVIGMDAQGRITDWSNRAETIFGWTRAEAIGRSLSETIIPFRYREAYAQGLQRFLATGERPVLKRRVELTALRKDGTELQVELSVSPMKSGDSQTFNAFIADITERKRMEEQLREAQKLEAVGQLAGGVAHDFNNLLTGILGNLSLVKLELGPASPVLPLITMAERSARRAADLTRQLLSVGRRTLTLPNALDLRDIVGEVAQLLRRTIDPRIVIEINAPDDLWTIQADPGQIHQVLMNLCLNARDAMAQGGRLTITLENSVYEGRSPTEIVRLIVTDTGEGMDSGTSRRIFEPFFTTKDVGKGTGLGLAVAYGIVKQHGGTIAVESAPGHGSRFLLEFPRASQDGRAVDFHGRTMDEASEPGSLPPGRGQTVLIVDDEAIVRGVARRTLEQSGYSVLEAEDGNEAIALYEQERGRIAAVILDMTMPHRSGVETLAELRRIEPAARVILCSGYSTEAHKFDWARLGAKAYLQKPYDPIDLADTLRHVLEL